MNKNVEHLILLLPGNHNGPESQRSLGQKEQVEEPVVFLTDASVQPWAVVVKLVDTPAAFLTVTCPQWLL